MFGLGKEGGGSDTQDWAHAHVRGGIILKHCEEAWGKTVSCMVLYLTHADQ